MKAMLKIEDGIIIGNADENFDETLGRLSYLHSVIRNLKIRDSVDVMDVAEIDEKLVSEIANYEMSTEEMKMDAVLLLVEDSIRLQEACFKNYGNLDNALESLRKIENLLNLIVKNNNINKSKALQTLTTKAKAKLNEIKGHMNMVVTKKKESKSEQSLQAKMRKYSG